MLQSQNSGRVGWNIICIYIILNLNSFTYVIKNNITESVWFNIHVLFGFSFKKSNSIFLDQCLLIYIVLTFSSLSTLFFFFFLAKTFSTLYAAFFPPFTFETQRKSNQSSVASSFRVELLGNNKWSFLNANKKDLSKIIFPHTYIP